MLSVTKGLSGSTSPGGRMKTMPQEMKEEKVEERKAMGMGGKLPVRVALGET